MVAPTRKDAFRGRFVNRPCGRTGGDVGPYTLGGSVLSYDKTLPPALPKGKATSLKEGGKADDQWSPLQGRMRSAGDS